MPTFTITERAILDALARHASQGEDITLSELASECHVSKSTVVRAMKKLGYRGYRDFEHTFRIGGPKSGEALLPRHPVLGAYDQAARALADAFEYARGKKSIIYSGGAQESAYLASYMSRKLALFNVFAPASYDYAMFDTGSLEPGCALFLQQQHHGSAPGADMQALELARDRGFHVIIISNAEKSTTATPERTLIALTPDTPPLDLFMPKVLMVFERALELLAAEQEKTNHARSNR